MPKQFAEYAKGALALFGSTSPSYLILSSLDVCNRRLSEGYREKLEHMVARLDEVRRRLREQGWQIPDSDPLRVTVRTPAGVRGEDLAEQLREHGIECEYADDVHLVLMTTPENTDWELDRFCAAMGNAPQPERGEELLPVPKGESVCSIRQALFAPHETIPTGQALGRICAAPTVSCPPAIPIAVSGERIGPEAMELFLRYRVSHVDVLRETT